jgi:hypothetical protein
MWGPSARQWNSGGHITNGQFVDAGSQLIHARAIQTSSTSRPRNGRKPSCTTNTLGDGFVECILTLPTKQRSSSNRNNVALKVRILSTTRFDWALWLEAQQASLLSPAGDAYLNEMGITSKFDGANGRSSSAE